ncbi:hypothetical protein CRYUN_Cryun20dG0008500 [Craigia yunnanensis]
MQAEPSAMSQIILSVVFTGLIVLAVQYLLNALILKPKRLRSKLQKQGIKGPSTSILLGNILDIKRIESRARSSEDQPNVHLDHAWPLKAYSYIEQWRNEYGPVFIYSTGNIQFLCVTDVEMVKEINLCTSLSLGKPSFLSKYFGPLLGEGILASSGPLWDQHRKTIAPELYLDKVKGMVNLMVESTNSMIKYWKQRVQGKGGMAEIEVDQDLRSLSAEIISRACFGSSYSEGEEIFFQIRTLQKVMPKGKTIMGVPGLRLLPTKNNREKWKLEKEINSKILKVVKQRTEAGHEKDLLQMILEGAKSNIVDHDGLSYNSSADKFIVDNCKNIYYAGHETTAMIASWSLMLLAAHPDWQTRVRAEVLQICIGGILDFDMLRSMKVLTMVIQETLRLYPPAVFVMREVLQDIEFKGVMIPKGTNIQIPVATLHQITDLWGPGAHQFNPERFATGVLGACKHPQAYLPFGVGARTCVGQHFAMTELKIVLSLILSKFSFSLSPAYQHSPVSRMVLEPEHGICLYVRRS